MKGEWTQWLEPRHWLPDSDGDDLGDRMTAAAHLADLAYQDLGHAAEILRRAGWKVCPVDESESEGFVIIAGDTVVWVARGTDFEGDSLKSRLFDAGTDLDFVRRRRWPPFTPPGVRLAAGAVRYARRALREIDREIPRTSHHLAWRIFLVGHSLAAGGVLAAVPALVHEGYEPQAVYAFDPPRVASSWIPWFTWLLGRWPRGVPLTSSADWYDREFLDSRKIAIYRSQSILGWVHSWVGMVPPRILGAAAVGGLLVHDRREKGPMAILSGEAAASRWRVFKLRVTDRGERLWARIVPLASRLLRSTRAHSISDWARDLAARPRS